MLVIVPVTILERMNSCDVVNSRDLTPGEIKKHLINALNPMHGTSLLLEYHETNLLRNEQLFEESKLIDAFTILAQSKRTLCRNGGQSDLCVELKAINQKGEIVSKVEIDTDRFMGLMGSRLFTGIANLPMS